MQKIPRRELGNAVSGEHDDQRYEAAQRKVEVAGRYRTNDPAEVVNDGTANVAIVNQLGPGWQITGLIGDQREEKQDRKTRQHEPECGIPGSDNLSVCWPSKFRFSRKSPKPQASRKLAKGIAEHLLTRRNKRYGHYRTRYFRTLSPWNVRLGRAPPRNPLWENFFRKECR